MTVYRPVFDVTVGDARVSNLDAEAPEGALSSITVFSSRRPEADTARIEFPYDVEGLDISTFSEGDEVAIALGNVPGISAETVFVGEVVTIGPDKPVWLECRDALHQLGKEPVNKVYKDVGPGDIGGVVAELAGSGVGVEMGDVPPQFKLKRFRCDHCTPRFALRELAAKVGVDFYAIPGQKKIYFGYPFAELVGKQDFVPVFEYGLNILDEGTLAYREKKPVGRVVVYGVDAAFKERTVKAVYPAKAGEGPVRTFELEGGDRNAAAEEAERRYLELASSRYEGSFTTLGRGDTRHSMRCKVDDPRQPARSLHAYVESVTHRCGRSYKMEVGVGHGA